MCHDAGWTLETDFLTTSLILSLQEESKELLEKKEGEEGDKEEGEEKEEVEKGEEAETKESPSKGSSLLESIRNVASHVPALFKKDKEKVILWIGCIAEWYKPLTTSTKYTFS